MEREDATKANNIIANAKKAALYSHDAAREMDNLLKYAKVVEIRDIQKAEHKKMEEDYKKKEQKLDLMMELERLKELKKQQDRELSRKIQQREGSKVVIDQIKEKELERVRQKAIVERERIMMNRQMAELQEQDRRNAERKKLEAERLAKEVETINKINALNKEKKKLAEKELDLKMHQYNLAKMRKDEEIMEEKRRIAAEKEMEVQRLREKQERAQDKQAQLDEIRAKRAYEEEERKQREKERQEVLKREQMKKELIEANEIQKLAKGMRLKEQADRDKEDYDYIVKHQIEDMERDRKLEDERKRRRYEHNDELKRQIKLKEEKFKVEQRQKLEEGRETQQNLDEYMKNMQQLKQEKLAEMERLGIKGKYRVDLEKYKIK